MGDMSSDEEDHSRLLQAVDKQFISDELFNNKSEFGSVNCEKQAPVPLPSLRHQDVNHWDQNNVLGLNVTPEFQNYVAKHLSALLERQLKDVEPKASKKKRKRKKVTGVRLFHSSSSYLDTINDKDISAAHNAKRKQREKELDSEEENERVNAVAVSSDWLLSGAAVQGWEKCTRGEVIEGVCKDSEVRPTNGLSK